MASTTAPLGERSWSPSAVIRRPSAVTSWRPSTTAGAAADVAGGSLGCNDLGGLSRLTPGCLTVTMGDTRVLDTGVRLRREAGSDSGLTGVRVLRPGGADTGRPG